MNQTNSMNQTNPMNQINPMNVVNNTGSNVENPQNNNVSEIQEFFNYLNSQNNMNLKKIIFFYSKFSKLCEQFINSLHPNYKVLLSMISVDNPIIRKRLMNSKYKLQYVPCIFMLFENGKVNMHYGNELVSLVSFLNKNMEAFMVKKTNENLAKRKNIVSTGQGRTQLNNGVQSEQMESKLNNSNNELDNNMDEIVHNSNRPNITSLNLAPKPKKINERQFKMKNLPRIKESIPEDFKRDMDVGISSKRIVPKGRKEHKKMARTSLTVLESNKQLDTIEEEGDEDDTDDEEEIDIQMEDAEILDNILEEQDDNTIDPILLKGDKNKIKDIAAEMAKERGPVDDKPMNR